MHFGLQWHGVDPTAVVKLSVLFQIQKIQKELTKNLQKDYKLPKNLKVQMKIVTYLSRSDILGGHQLTDLQYILPFDLKVNRIEAKQTDLHIKYKSSIDCRCPASFLTTITLVP